MIVWVSVAFIPQEKNTGVRGSRIIQTPSRRSMPASTGSSRVFNKKIVFGLAPHDHQPATVNFNAVFTASFRIGLVCLRINTNFRHSGFGVGGLHPVAVWVLVDPRSGRSCGRFSFVIGLRTDPKRRARGGFSSTRSGPRVIASRYQYTARSGRRESAPESSFALPERFSTHRSAISLHWFAKVGALQIRRREGCESFVFSASRRRGRPSFICIYRKHSNRPRYSLAPACPVRSQSLRAGFHLRLHFFPNNAASNANKLPGPF